MSFLRAKIRYERQQHKLQLAHDIIHDRMDARREHNMDSIIDLNHW